MTVVKFQTFDEQIGDRFSEERMIARLTMLFGGLALLLATIGLYGVTAYTVVRTDVGDWYTDGAGRGARSVVAMIMRGAMIQTCWGWRLGFRWRCSVCGL